MKLNKIFNIIVLSLFIISCSSESSDFLPIPKGFNHISLPEHEYVEFNEEGFPYTFEISKYVDSNSK